MAANNGTTTNSYVQILDASATEGCLVVGSVKNTGTNTMSIRLTVTSCYGGSNSQVSALLPDCVWSANSVDSNLLGLDPNYSELKIEVKSTVINLATDFQSLMVGQGV